MAPEKEVMVLADATADKLSWSPGDTIRQTVQVEEESGLYIVGPNITAHDHLVLLYIRTCMAEVIIGDDYLHYARV